MLMSIYLNSTLTTYCKEIFRNKDTTSNEMFTPALTVIPKLQSRAENFKLTCNFIRNSAQFKNNINNLVTVEKF